jgi:hypothetical protein
MLTRLFVDALVSPDEEKKRVRVVLQKILHQAGYTEVEADGVWGPVSGRSSEGFKSQFCIQEEGLGEETLGAFSQYTGLNLAQYEDIDALEAAVNHWIATENEVPGPKYPR